MGTSTEKKPLLIIDVTIQIYTGCNNNNISTGTKEHFSFKRVRTTKKPKQTKQNKNQNQRKKTLEMCPQDTNAAS